MAKKVAKTIKQTKLFVTKKIVLRPSEIIKAHEATKKDKQIRKNIKLSVIAHMKKHSIGSAVYSNWYCGITNQTACARLRQHQVARQFSGVYLKFFDAESMPNAHNIEVFFHTRGMKNDKRIGNAKENSMTVYVFKEDKTLVDLLIQILNPPLDCK